MRPLRTCLLFCLPALLASCQASEPYFVTEAAPSGAPAVVAVVVEPRDAAPTVPVTVPTFENSTCPIMGKPVSTEIYVDTDRGRFYVCCKPCVKKILADVPTAYLTAYPVAVRLDNGTCPITGKAIAAGAETVILQGYEFSVCCPKCVPIAQQDAQTTLVKLTMPEIDDVGNTICPLTDEPVRPNAFAIVERAMIRLSSPECVEQLRQNPVAAVARAKGDS